MVSENEMMSLFIIFAVIAVAVTAKLIVFFNDFNRETRMIAAELRRAETRDEYHYWRRELRCHYLCLIPFVNERNAMRLYRRLYHKRKKQGKEKRGDGLYHMLAPSMLGALLSTVCLCGASWAWFTASSSSGVAEIKAARYSVSVELTEQAAGPIEALPDGNGIYTINTLEVGEYTFFINADGSANNGYCKLELDSDTYYTVPIQKGGSLKFKLIAYESLSLRLTPQWGSCSENSRDKLIGSNEGIVFGQPTDKRTEPINDTPSSSPQPPKAALEASTPKTDATTQGEDETAE